MEINQKQKEYVESRLETIGAYANEMRDAIRDGRLSGRGIDEAMKSLQGIAGMARAFHGNFALGQIPEPQ